MPGQKLHPHDRYMKSVMSHKAIYQEFFEGHLPPALKQAIDMESIELQKESYVDDKLNLQIADLLYAAKIEGKPGYIYLLLEHASKPDKLLPFRMLKYMVAIMEQHLKTSPDKTLPLIYPIIIYTGQRRYPYSMDLFKLFGAHEALARETLLSSYHLLDLTQVSDEEFMQYHLFGMVALIAKHIHDADILPILRQVIAFMKRFMVEGGEGIIYTILTYVIEAGEVSSPEGFVAAVKELKVEDEEKIMTLAEHWKKEGLQKGLQMGKEEGLEEGKYRGFQESQFNIALNCLRLELSLDQIQQITGLSLKELESLKQKMH